MAHLLEKNSPSRDPAPDPTAEGGFRHWLAAVVTIVSIIGAVVLGAFAIASPTPNSTAQTILSMVLPVIGTWVGTVLAYYFSKENMEAATRSVATIARQLTPEERLRSKPVQDVMIPLAKMFFVRGPANELNLVEAVKELDASRKGDRLPVLNKEDWPLYVVHRSTVDRFLVNRASANPPAALNTLTLADMLANPDLKSALEKSFAVVRASATLADAKTAMDALTFPQDVFVTSNGSEKEAVIGWITNAIIEENARV
jgi:hypothetical protein